ncbi:MAG: metal-dependent protease of the PAD1/JAB1 superfamily [Methanosarcinales archaeon]|nr:metal-dependent protease of the PAD1/JAB1 superfamily [Methanosarcinales archaeon]
MRRRVQGIAKDTLSFIMEACRDTMPREFAALLRAEDGIISDVLILPGTDSNERQASVKLYMLPNMQIVGSVHSHPNGVLRPSGPDLAFFSPTGSYHLIAGPPFDERSWACFDPSGNPRVLEILDVDLEDDIDGFLDEEGDF